MICQARSFAANLLAAFMGIARKSNADESSPKGALPAAAGNAA